MKSGERILIAAGLIAGGAWLLRGELEPWIQHTPAGPAVAALFRTVSMPGGNVAILRPPAESRPALSKLISGAPRDAMLYRLRAQEAEMALDFTAAEADWKTYAQAAADHYAAQIELADFYHRRFRPRDEVAALTTTAAAKDDPHVPANRQKGWQAYERIATVIAQDALPEPEAETAFRAWVARYPQEPEARRKLIEYLGANKRYAAAGAEIASYSRAFPDTFTPVRMRADLEVRRGRPEAALAIYDRAFQPLWPDEMRASYFKLLENQGQLREFAGRARTALTSNPTDLNATARLFHYFRQQNNIPAARRVLLEYRMAKESGQPSGAQPWTADELQTAAQLFEWLPDVNEAARLYYALYSAPPAGGAQAERALFHLSNLLLTAPSDPIQFGSGDLSFYKDIATVDSSPGFLNGILSLLLNGTGLGWEYQNQNQKSVAYFHRAAAAQLVALLEKRFPQSAYREPLHAAMISAYSIYGDDAGVIRAGREFLAAFPNGAGRVAVAMQMSDALARANRTGEEFALYDQLLRELAAKSYGIPIGAGAPSGEYVQVLDKYLSRLASLRRPLDALRVYRGEIDRNPNDQGLYERLAAFLEQNGTSREVEAVYAQAIAKFPDRSWYHKLARWYLRRREYNAVEKISRDAIAVFSGSELERYFTEIVSQTHPDAVLYRQLNQYAHERFPEDMAFVHNLVGAYNRKETYDAAAAERLLRQYWFYDPQFRAMLFERLWEHGRLYPELAQIRAANPGIVDGHFDQALASNPAAVQFVLEAEVWLSHFEAAAPVALAMATAYPGHGEFTTKASALYRSLAAYDPHDTDVAVAMAGFQHAADPRDPTILARMGDILAEQELFSRARTFWERIPSENPGKPDGYLDAATIYWDYYLYGDALRWIAAARKKFNDPALFAYQAGAIEEGKRDYAGAVREYMAGALHGESAANSRLLRLLNKRQTRGMVDQSTAAAVASNPSPQAVSLRIAVLEAEQRRSELEALLRTRVEAEKSSSALTQLQENARRLGFDRIEERASERLAAITNDPVDKMRLTLDYIRLLEAKKDIAGAARTADALYRAHPLILGVVRGVVDFHTRNQQPDKAIDILLDASKHARTDLAAGFTLESARIATAAGQLDRARTLLNGLLAADPLRAGYLAAMGDTWLHAKDDAGFRDYQFAIIQRLKLSHLTAAERIERIAAIRRALIPALDRLKDSAGATDQYIEVVDSYPEDAELTKEAAAYAVTHGQAPRMVAFYRQTIAAAPLDYRWPIVLARIETVAEDYPAAIADYERAIKARPDRADLLEAKGRLEERLMRFDEAIKSYGRLYELAYRDPRWLIKVAELRARTGQNAAAVAALETAIIGARTRTADAEFEIAERLETWHIMPDAVAFAERGASLAGPDLFKDMGHAVIYARIMTKARRADMLLPRLTEDSPSRHQVAQAVGRVINGTYTPEEKTRFEQALISGAAGMPVLTRDATLLPLAEAAGMVDLEARWRWESMAAAGLQVDQTFVALQSQRGLYGELGTQLEDYAAQNTGLPVAGNALSQAAQAFIAEGNVDNQMRVMQKALARNALSGELLDRYLGLLAQRQPDQLLAIVRGNGSAEIRNRAIQFALGGDHRELTYSAIRTRGMELAPVWSKAYTALAGEYFDDRSPAIDAAFQAALDTRTIGARLQTVLKPDSIIAGTLWFYFGARYGDYLASGKNASAERWLPASLEAAPGNPGAYMAMGDSYAARGQGARAITQFEHALELDPDRGDAHDHIARTLWSEGRQTEAIGQWKSALAAFLRIQSRGVRVPESFWDQLAETFTDIGQRHALGELRGDIVHLLGDYYQRNREYRIDELVAPAVRASVESGEGTGWLVDLARSMENPDPILYTLARDPGITEPQRITLHRAMVNIWAQRAESTFGANRENAQTMLTQARWQLISMLLDAGDVKAASEEWNLVAAADAANYDRSVEIRLASRTGTLDALLDRYRSDPSKAPSAEMLQRAVESLRKNGDETAARTVLAFLYDREIRNGHLEAPNFLGLAEVDLQRGETGAAVALLNRMALVVDGADGDDFETLLPAAELLGNYGKTAESVDFIRRRMKAAPWDSEAKVDLARMLSKDSAERQRLLEGAVTDRDAAYALRAEASRLAAPQRLPGISGTELALLSSPVTPEAAGKPYQVEARMQAADAAADPEVKLRLWREALALAPTDGRARLGALRTAIALRRDSLSVALERGTAQPDGGFNNEMHFYRRHGRLMPYRQPGPATVLPQIQLSDGERAALAESLSAAAEQLDDLNAAQSYLRTAIDLRAPNQRDALERRLSALAAEQDRRMKNAARQPVIKNAIEQDQVVRPRILRSAQ